MNPFDLAAAKAAAKDETSSPEERAFLLHSAPSSFTYSDGMRVEAPDGIVRTSDPKRIVELDAAVAVGNISLYNQGQSVAPQQIPVDPANPTGLPL